MRKQLIIYPVVVLLGVLIAGVSVLWFAYGVTVRRLRDADPACPAGKTITDYYREFTRGFSSTRYGCINGRPAVRPGDVVLDCGAYTGDTTREFLALGASLVIAIDPSQYAISRLRQNLAREIAAHRVIVREVAALDRDGWIDFYEHPEDHAQNGVVIRMRKSERRVPTRTIDGIVKELALDHVDFIKMDIEGAEQRALLGARETILRFKPRLAIATYHLADDYEKIPLIVEGIRPDYAVEAARCLVSRTQIFPNLLHFY